MLGSFPGLPDRGVSELVVDHDWIVRRQWRDSIDGDYWEHLQQQEALFCPTCNASRATPEVEPSLGKLIQVPAAAWRGLEEWDEANPAF